MRLRRGWSLCVVQISVRWWSSISIHLKMKLFKRIYVGYSAALMVLRGVISGQYLRALIGWNVE
jgi:hypothetical protein